MNAHSQIPNFHDQEYAGLPALRGPLESIFTLVPGKALLLVRLRQWLGRIPIDDLKLPIFLLVATTLFGHFARTLAEFNPVDFARPAVAEHAYALPKSKAQLSQCIAKVQAEHPGAYDSVRYLGREGIRSFVFHAADPIEMEDHWSECDADTGRLIGEIAPDHPSQPNP